MTSIAPTRFVILHHQVSSGLGRTDEDHFDWMFQTGPTLTTFATSIISQMHSAFEAACSRLPDHRIEYLDFEGLIPDRGALRNRGSVRRVTGGTFMELENTPDCFCASLIFDSMRADVDFSLVAEHHWVLRYAPASEVTRLRSK